MGVMAPFKNYQNTSPFNPAYEAKLRWQPFKALMWNILPKPAPPITDGT
ncbi:MAG: hypothetical protein H0A76_05690 [Candidatus Thiodubiliella endoseptemdiera]|uniref:Uncharacterized protein n=1 Tax=Candidatus Thiodubiliella endoseptemdiera TaxID=2738886 RepID=A0A853F5A6_9GAMM|nr:hypothetical protein [Candidatus Thiodubiliella endoseptemdiera]